METVNFAVAMTNVGLPLVNRMVYAHCDNPHEGTDELAALNEFVREGDGSRLYTISAFMAQRCAYLTQEGDRHRCFHPGPALVDVPPEVAVGAELGLRFLLTFTHGEAFMAATCVQGVVENGPRAAGFVGEIVRQLTFAHLYAHETFDRCQWARFHPENN